MNADRLGRTLYTLEVHCSLELDSRRLETSCLRADSSPKVCACRSPTRICAKYRVERGRPGTFSRCFALSAHEYEKEKGAKQGGGIKRSLGTYKRYTNQGRPRLANDVPTIVRRAARARQAKSKWTILMRCWFEPTPHTLHFPARIRHTEIRVPEAS